MQAVVISKSLSLVSPPPLQ